MRKNVITACFVLAGLTVLFNSTLDAQNVVFNGDFETTSYSPMWTLSGGNVNTQMAFFATKLGAPNYCIKRRPGPPSNNGALQQDIHLLAGETYIFSADVAADYCST